MRTVASGRPVEPRTRVTEGATDRVRMVERLHGPSVRGDPAASEAVAPFTPDSNAVTRIPNPSYAQPLPTVQMSRSNSSDDPILPPQADHAIRETADRATSNYGAPIHSPALGMPPTATAATRWRGLAVAVSRDESTASEGDFALRSALVQPGHDRAVGASLRPPGSGRRPTPPTVPLERHVTRPNG